MNFPSKQAILALLLGLAAPACGDSDAGSPSQTAADPAGAPTATSPSSPSSPPSAAPWAPTAGSDGGGPDTGTPSTRARCGAAPYQWVVSSLLGDVLDSSAKASHTPLDLNYALYEAKNQNALKTNRLSKYGTKSRLVRYQTQDRGKLIDATTLVTLPDVSDARTFPILLVLHGTAGFNDACAPSREVADDLLGGFSDGTAVLLSLFASFGYITVAPDYIGLKSMGSPTGFLHPYLVAEPTAIASLDSVRAAKKLLAGSNVTPGELVVMGGSQGGHAAAFVNRYAPHYAPELTIKGSVWDVPPTDLVGHAKLALTSWRSSTDNLIAFTTTFDSWYGSAPGGLGSALLAPYVSTVPAALANSCSPGDVFANGASLQTVFTPAFRAAGASSGFAGVAPWACYAEENSLPTTSVPKLDSVPSLFLLGQNDDLVDPAVERASFQKLCAQGHVLTYLECAGASHTKPLTYAFDQWLDFLEARIAGTPLTGTCVVKPAEHCTSTP
jgi:dienelactone hydrolase